MNILITGITGRIGAALARRLEAEGHTVRGLVWPPGLGIERLDGLSLELITGSLTDRAAIERAADGAEVICHLGAAFQAGGPFTNDDYFEINLRGTFNLLEAARQRGDALRQFFFASSDALYDKYTPTGLRAPIQEDATPLAATGAYPLTKYLGEEMCLGYVRTYRLPVTVFRFALTVGPGEIRSWPQFFLSHWQQAFSQKSGPEAEATRAELERLASSQPNALLIARDANGRSWKKHIAHSQDIVGGFLAALDKPAAIGEVFQLAGPAPFTWEEAVPALARKLNRPVVDVRLAGQTPTFYEFDISKARQRLGFAPAFDIQRMIDEG